MLLAAERHLRIDSNRRILTFHTRRIWFEKRTVVVPMSRIKSVIYGHSHAWLKFSPGERGPTSTPDMDRFHVGLLLEGDQQPLHLFTFHGDPAIVANLVKELPDLSIPDLETDEEDSSREFVNALRIFLGVPARSLMQSMVYSAIKDELHPCPRCARKIMRTAEKCVYCGSRLKAVA